LRNKVLLYYPDQQNINNQNLKNFRSAKLFFLEALVEILKIPSSVHRKMLCFRKTMLNLVQPGIIVLSIHHPILSSFIVIEKSSFGEIIPANVTCWF